MMAPGNAAQHPLSGAPGAASRAVATTTERLSVVLPVYNEALILPELLAALRRVLDRLDLDWEVIFVNDGSRDASPRVLDELAREDGRVHVIHLSRNFGHQAAVQAGLSFAQGDAVVLMDSDMQDAPEAIPQFLEKWREGCDVVYAVRTKRKENVLKRALFAGFYRFLAAVATTPIPLDAGIFGLIDRRVAQQIVQLRECDRFFPGLRSWVGYRQTGVLIERQARYDDTPRVALRGLWRLAKTAIFSFSSFPLMVFYLIGYSALVIFVGLSSYSLFCKLFTNLAIPGWTSHILSASFFGALNALGISILGEYVIRIYDQVRGRPLFIVDRHVNAGTGGAAGVRSHVALPVAATPGPPVVEAATEAAVLEWSVVCGPELFVAGPFTPSGEKAELIDGPVGSPTTEVIEAPAGESKDLAVDGGVCWPAVGYTSQDAALGFDASPR